MQCGLHGLARVQLPSPPLFSCAADVGKKSPQVPFGDGVGGAVFGELRAEGAEAEADFIESDPCEAGHGLEGCGGGDMLSASRNPNVAPTILSASPAFVSARTIPAPPSPVLLRLILAAAEQRIEELLPVAHDEPQRVAFPAVLRQLFEKGRLHCVLPQRLQLAVASGAESASAKDARFNTNRRSAQSGPGVARPS